MILSNLGEDLRLRMALSQILHMPGQICCLFHAICEGCARSSFFADGGPVETGNLIGHMVDCL